MFRFFLYVGLGVPVLTTFFMWYEIPYQIDRTFLGAATFIFSIFTGFFVTRQSARFNKVRETVTAFDGKMSSIYRMSSHISSACQKAMGDVIVSHYEKIFTSKQWNYHFARKSTTLSALHQTLDQFVEEDKVTKLSNQAIGSIIKALAACQDLRKQMVALAEEKLSYEQWLLVAFFGFVLVSTVAGLPSFGLLFTSIVKASFVVSIGAVVVILYKLDNLAFTERLMGDRSAHDVVDIVAGKK